MDWGVLAGWAGAVAGYALAIATIVMYVDSKRNRGKDESALRVADLLKPIFAQLARHEDHHGKHFYAENAITSLAASLSQEVKDNKRHADERADRGDDMLKEIRADIKTLLQR